MTTLNPPRKKQPTDRCGLLIAVRNFWALCILQPAQSTTKTDHRSQAVLQAIFLVIATSGLLLAQESDSVDRDYSAELPRFAALTPQEALSAFKVADGFEIELVASEPLVQDPIAAAFDDRYRMYVVEMRGYSEQADEKLGRIALLSDENGDGVMDKRTTFAEGLSWPTAIAVWRDGVVVAVAPDVMFFADRDGDGKAEIREKWFSGFGRGNVQGLVNSLRWSPRGYLHGATSSSGGAIDTGREKLGLLRRDFQIDPTAKTIAAATGGGQHGLSFNSFGDKFVTSNSDHLQQVLDFESWLATLPSNVATPRLRRSIAEDGPQATVYRTSPVEPWRLVRTRLRTKGIVPGPIEGGGTAAGYFTGATGTCITDALQNFGLRNADTALVCDVGSNLIHRKHLKDTGIFWTASRIDRGSELVASSDTWFRPVQLEQGPDGSVYILDMYREVIEHPKSLPPVIKRHLDLTSGRDRGRIYRLRPTQWRVGQGTIRQGAISPPPAELGVSQLVERLFSPIPWQRMTASRMLIEQATSDEATSGANSDANNDAVRHEIAGALRAKLAGDKQSEAGAIAAVHCLARINGNAEQTFLRDLLASTESARVQESILEAIANNAERIADIDWLDELAGTTDPRLQIQLARLTANFGGAEQRINFLTSLAAGATDPIATFAIAASAGSDDWQIVRQLIHKRSLRSAQPWIKLLLPNWMNNTGQHPAATSWLRQELEDCNVSELRIWIDAIGDLQRGELERFRSIAPVSELPAFKKLVAGLESPSDKTTALKALRLAELEPFVDQVGELLSLGASASELEQISELIRLRSSSALGQSIIEHLPRVLPTEQQKLLRAFASSPHYHPLLATSIEEGKLPIGMIATELREQLSQGSSQSSMRFTSLFVASNRNRQAVVDRYTQIVQPKSKPTSQLAESHQAVWDRGKVVFEKNCSQCHRLHGVGLRVGPELKDLANKSVEQLAKSIFDPASEIDPRFLSYSVLTEDGQAITGIVTATSGRQVTLVEAGGKTHQLTRSVIAEMKSSGKSLMPEGLEQQVAPEQFADLLYFLQNIQ